MGFTTRVLAAVSLAFALTVGTASASQWWVETGEGKLKQPVPAGETVSVPTTGTLILRFKAPGRRIVTARCTVEGTQALTDTPTEALGETSAMAFSGCSGGLAVTPILPWSSALVEGPGSPFTDQLSNVAVNLSIEGTSFGTLAGSLAAVYGDADPPLKDDLDNSLKIKPRSGTLTGPAGALTLTGQMRFGVKGVDGAGGEPLTFANGLTSGKQALRLEAALAAAAVTDSDVDD